MVENETTMLRWQLSRRGPYRLTILTLYLLASACRGGTPSSVPRDQDDAAPVTDHSTADLLSLQENTEVTPGSDLDLRMRGGVRAEDSWNAASELHDRWLTVTLQTRASNGNWWTLAAGGEIRTGEVLITEVELLRPAHVYVINVSASGRTTLLYPVATYERDALLGQGFHRLPPERSEYPYIRLDHEIGTERLYVIASPEPIVRVDRDLGTLVTQLQCGESPAVLRNDQPSTGPASTAKLPEKRPQTLKSARSRERIERSIFEANQGAIPDLNSRGGYRTRVSGAAIDAKAGDDGVVVVPFQFEHI
jgi:hypothetical protein